MLASHYHETGPSSNTSEESHVPKSRSVIVINKTYSDGMIIPKGGVLIFNTTDLPDNWTRLDTFDGFYIIGNSHSIAQLLKQTDTYRHEKAQKIFLSRHLSRFFAT